MSNSGKFTDRSQSIKEAGHTSTIQGITADNSLRQDLYYKPNMTPEKIRKFRKSEREIIGKKQFHYGIYDDDKAYENNVHGVKTKGSDHVETCIKGSNLNGIGYFLNKINEDKFASSKKEPLESRLQRNYIFPDQVNKDEFRFGVQTTGCKLNYNI